MLIDIVYFKTAQMPDFETKLAKYGDIVAKVGEEKRAFLIALSEAVERSNVIITVGEIKSLASTLAKGLSLPLTAVNWAAIGISGNPDATLPQGALPLIVDGEINGMIIESDSQCIIAIDSDICVAQMLADTYITAYLDALCNDAESQITSQAEQEPENELESDDDYPEIQPVEHFEEDADDYEDEAPDLFADIEEDDFLIIDDRKKGKGAAIAIIIVLAVLIIGAVGGYFGYTLWWMPRQYDAVVAEAEGKYKSGSLDADNIPAEYSLRFGELYGMNDDVIGWINADGISLNTPIVTESGLERGYYTNRIFDGTVNKYGTPHIKFAYDTDINVNPNLVVYGNNFGDGRAFAELEKLLDGNIASDVILHTDSVFYGDESWRIFSVMTVSSDGSEYDFTNNFAKFTVDERKAALKAALSLSKISLDVTETDFDTVSLNDIFLTLVTPCSEDNGKSVVVMAKKIKSSNENSAPIVEAEPTEDDFSSESASSEVTVP